MNSVVAMGSDNSRDDLFGKPIPVNDIEWLDSFGQRVLSFRGREIVSYSTAYVYT